MPVPARSAALFAFAASSFAYYAYAGLFGTYAPLWFQSLGYGTLAIGALISLQSATRMFGPYAWGWLADHSGQRIRLLRVAIVGALLCASGLSVSTHYGWIALVTAALYVCTSGVQPISEAALAHFVSSGGTLDVARYGRVRVWGSVGFMVSVVGCGALMQSVGVGWFPGLAAGLLAAALIASFGLPVSRESPQQPGEAAPGALAVLRRPVVAWFFGSVFFTVLAHTSLYAFFSLYLASLGYGKAAIGLIWATGVAAEVSWFWFQGRWVERRSPHGWLILAAALTAVRFALVALFGALPWVLVPLQLMHALTFAGQHGACIALINQNFPARLRGRGQALYTVLGYGTSGVVGGLAGGALSQRYGYTAVFWGASVAGLAGLACSVIAWRLARRAA